MKRITKECRTSAQAARYHNALYNKYNQVTLVDFPRFSPQGMYVWEVSTTNT